VVDAAHGREKLGTILVTMELYSRAQEVLERAAVALRLAGDLESLGRVVDQIGRAHARKGTWAEGITHVESHLGVLATAGPTHGLAALTGALALLYQQDGQYEVALAVATRAVAVARALGDDRLLARASMLRGTNLLFDGRPEEALPVLQEARVLAEAVGHLDVLGWAAFGLAVIAEDRGELQLAGHYASRMLEAGERLEDAYLVRVAQLRLEAHAFYTGAWRDAHAYLERVAALPDRALLNEASVPFELGRLCLVEGAWEQATDYLEQCRALLQHTGERIIYPVAECLLAEREVLEGCPAAAVARLLPLLDRAGRVLTMYVLPMLAWAYLELGDVELAARTIEDLLQQVRARHYWFGLVDALRVQALVALRQGDVAGAERALEEGLALAHPMPYPYGEGRLLAVYGRLHLHRGERALARERLEAALAILQRLGARKDVEQVEGLLAALG
jgi:tetratricopeptide (TPR) repeat protein